MGREGEKTMREAGRPTRVRSHRSILGRLLWLFDYMSGKARRTYVHNTHEVVV